MEAEEITTSELNSPPAAECICLSNADCAFAFPRNLAQDTVCGCMKNDMELKWEFVPAAPIADCPAFVKGNSVFYKNAETGADFEYTVREKSLRHTVYLHEDSPAILLVRFAVNNLKHIMESKRFDFYEITEVEYTKCTMSLYVGLYLKDAAGVESENAVYYVSRVMQESEFDLEIQFDEEWMHAKERKFPVTLTAELATSLNRPRVIPCAPEREKNKPKKRGEGNFARAAHYGIILPRI